MTTYIFTEDEVRRLRRMAGDGGRVRHEAEPPSTQMNHLIYPRAKSVEILLSFLLLLYVCKGVYQK